MRPGIVLRVPAAHNNGDRGSRVARPAPETQRQRRADVDRPTAARSNVNVINRPADTRVAALDQKATRSVVSGSSTPSTLRWPVRGRIIEYFGKRKDGSSNDGINIAVPKGTDVHAAEAGDVAYAGSELKGFGNLVLIRHDSGWVTAYAHNDTLLVKHGQRVSRGQVIAKSGNSGSVEQPQLHFEVRKGSSPVNPLTYLGKP
jgi:murein DD-endopeptidase MepM/ murein hydrolase activator NlpD